MEIQFNTTDVESWVALCDQEGAMRRSGAPEEQLASMRIRLTIAMVDLLPNLTEDEKNNLVIALLSQTNAEQVSAPLEDPSTNLEPASQTSQTTEQADLPSQGPP